MMTSRMPTDPPPIQMPWEPNEAEKANKLFIVILSLRTAIECHHVKNMIRDRAVFNYRV
jgi:hypothetical protein